MVKSSVFFLAALAGLLQVSLAPASPATPHESTPAHTRTDQAAPQPSTITIPGPLRSFLRMAGISLDVTQEEVIPLIAHDVVLHGYQLGHPTEYLILVRRYVNQAQELTALAGSNSTIHITSCADSDPLLHLLGYRIQGECGKPDMTVVTADPERAFLTIDSGFPLLDLEEALQKNAPFSYNYSGTNVPVIFAPKDWIGLNAQKNQEKRDFLDTLLYEPRTSRLYWSMYRIEPETREALHKEIGLAKLLPFNGLLDLYGSQLCIRNGAVVLPGGAAAEKEWKLIVGESPTNPGQFINTLFTKDHGWLASYYDAMARASQSQQNQFAQGQRLRRYYAAYLSPGDSADAVVRLAFRPAPALMVLVNRMQWDSNGDPYVPGSLPAWGEYLRNNTDAKLVKQWGKRAFGWQNPDQLAQTMFAFSRLEGDGTPVQAYLCLSELDRRRGPDHRLNAAAVTLLAQKYLEFGDQYLLFSEFPELNEESITRFLTTAESVGQIKDHTVRGNAMGIFQANVGLWQILARQKQIDRNNLNASFQDVLKPFSGVTNASQLFLAGRNSAEQVFRAATGRTNGTQEEFINLLAGAHQTNPEAQKIHTELANKIRSVLEDQRLVSIDTLFALDDGLKNPSQDPDAKARLVALAGELREFEMPQPIFTSSERTTWASGTYNNRHTELEMRADFVKAVGSASPAQIEAARGQLATFLRDSLVGMNYAYYEPPGSQVLHNNSLFVRSHDFSGDTVMGIEHLWRAPRLFGVGSPAGGGAHLIGSLADLPYVLAQSEQDFIAPDHVQALIWQQFTPGLLSSAIVPRWWNISRTELHAVALYQRAGEELLAASASDSQLRDNVVAVLSERMTPQHRAWLLQALQSGKPEEMMEGVSPADTFFLTLEFRSKYPQDLAAHSAAGRELETVDSSDKDKDELDPERLARDFGVIHPILTQTYSLELINTRPYPALGGSYSRLMGECWDSGNLYWARLADELNYNPSYLNRIVPVLTRRMVERIAASDLDDWPATLRAMRETGEEFRHGKIASLATNAPPGN
jgi:hypothetical protein